MMRIVSISDARNNLAKLIQSIKDTNEPIVIVQDSSPSAVLYPYNEAVANEKKKQQLFQIRFENLLDEGKKIGKKYLEENNIKQPISEEEAYNLIKNG